MRRLRKVSDSGVTLLEILLAMLILGLVTAGIFTAFVFSRQVSYRSEGELAVQGYIQQLADDLRKVVSVPPGSPGLGLEPGIYYDPNADYDPNTSGSQGPNNPCGATLHSVLPSPLGSSAAITRYQIRWRYYVEDHKTRTESPCNDPNNPPRGRKFTPATDLNGDGDTNDPGEDEPDLRWTRIVVDWTPPNP